MHGATAPLLPASDQGQVVEGDVPQAGVRGLFLVCWLCWRVGCGWEEEEEEEGGIFSLPPPGRLALPQG